MAPPAPTPHARTVPLHRTDGDAPAVQRGLPGVAPEEAPLTSERVLSGELLSDRRRESLARLRETLGVRPEGFTAEEWRVVVALLAPPSGGGMAGFRARSERARVACECFPGRTAPAAMRAFLEFSARPHIAEVVADFRALEMADILDQRALVREVLYNVMALAGNADEMAAVAAEDPGAAAKCGAAAVAAAKVLMDLDGLRAPPPARTVVDADAGPSGASKSGEDPRALLAAKIERVAEDLTARKDGA